MSHQPRRRLLSLDLATRIGWAYGDVASGDPKSGVHKLPSTGDDIGRFAVAYDEFLVDLIKEARPDIIVFEAPMATQAGKSPLATVKKLTGLCWHTEWVARVEGIQVREVHAGSWKKSFCGTGRVSKTRAKALRVVYPPIQACRDRGWNVDDDNEADAIGLFVHSCACLDQRSVARFDPLARAGLLTA